MTNDIAVKKFEPFSGSKTLKRENFMSNEKSLMSIFNKYDLDKNGELSAEETEKAQREIYSYCDKKGDCFEYSISSKKRSELKAQGVDIKAVAEFENRIDTTPYIDGKVTASFQGKEDDCGLLAGINALNTTPKGQEYIKQAIKTKEDGTYTVSLKGLNKSYNITTEDLKDNFYTTARGDSDVKLIEIAVKKYNRELIEKQNSGAQLTADEKEAIAVCSYNDPLAGGAPDDQALFYLTGKESKVYIPEKDRSKDPADKDSYIQNDELNKYLDDIMNHKSQYAAVTSFKTRLFHGRDMANHHTYTVKRVDKDNVILVDPANSEVEISLTRKKYLKNIKCLAVCDLNN